MPAPAVAVTAASPRVAIAAYFLASASVPEAKDALAQEVGYRSGGACATRSNFASICAILPSIQEENKHKCFSQHRQGSKTGSLEHPLKDWVSSVVRRHCDIVAPRRGACVSIEWRSMHVCNGGELDPLNTLPFAAVSTAAGFYKHHVQPNLHFDPLIHAPGRDPPGRRGIKESEKKGREGEDELVFHKGVTAEYLYEDVKRNCLYIAFVQMYAS
jgi:hypothetical protein